MKKTVLLSMLTATLLFGEDLGVIGVDATTINDVAQNAKLSADLSEVLSRDIPSIDMSRRSGIANDIIIRGLKRDNISVTIDGTKVYGACPNRMDPPISHVLTNNIQSVEVIEGPFDVSEYGTLGGGVKIQTLDPKKGWHGSVSFGGGSYGYQKIAVRATGGDDVVRFLVAASHEQSDQYKDGDGNTLAQQLINNTDAATAMYRYQSQYENMQAYTKRSFMTKLYVNPAQNQELRLSYTANRSSDVLYPNSPMDALYDDSNIYNIEYEIESLTPYYKSVIVQYFHTDVDHPMGTYYRNSGLIAVMENRMTSSYDAVRLKNRFDFGGFKTELGFEAGVRNWDGSYYKNYTYLGKSIANVDTNNYSTYVKGEKEFGALKLSGGVRYDYSDITPDDALLKNRSFDSVSAYLFADYGLTQEYALFVGVGRAQRVPDARELYFRDKTGNLTGTPTLTQVTNNEVDLGLKVESGSLDFKVKTFYAILQDYIYINSSKTTNIFENIDATIYGAELSSTYYATSRLSFDLQAAYKVGKKDRALTGQSDTDLADIAPLEGKIGTEYSYKRASFVRLELEARDRWSRIDSDNGEQELSSWAIANFKVKHSFNKNIDLTAGVNNIFNKTYVRSNTYKDLTLVTTGGETFALNEPGRYIYANFDLHF